MAKGRDQDREKAHSENAGQPEKETFSGPDGPSAENPSLGKQQPQPEPKKAAQEPPWYDQLESDFNSKTNDNGTRGGRHKQRKRRFKKVILALAGALLLMLIGVAGYSYNFYSDVQEPQRVLLDGANFEQDYTVSEAFSSHMVNIAVLGFDRGWSRERMGEEMFRPDMIAVLSINFGTGEVAVVRITRDAYVPIYGMGGMHDKINHSYFFGYKYGAGEDSHQAGIRYTINTISQTLGDIPIHYYISVDMYSVIELVDALGGVYYEVEETIYDKHWEIGRVLVPEGPQIMDGKTYLRYLQYRDEATDQDYGRIERQISLLTQTFVYLREEGKLTDIPATYRIYKDYVETDLSYTQIAALAYSARDLRVEDLEFYVLPGRGQTKDGIWYQILTQDDRLEIIKEVYGIEAERWPHIVLVDSPAYLEEQERLRREEERSRFFRNDQEEEEEKEKERIPGLPDDQSDQNQSNQDQTSEEPEVPADEQGTDLQGEDEPGSGEDSTGETDQDIAEEQTEEVSEEEHSD